MNIDFDGPTSTTNAHTLRQVIEALRAQIEKIKAEAAARINALKAVIRPEHTVVLVTHKPALLELVNRIVVVNSLGQGIVRDCHISELLKPSTTINSATPVSTAL